MRFSFSPYSRACLITWIADTFEDPVGGGPDGGLKLLGLHLTHAEGAVVAVCGRIGQHLGQLRLS